MPEEVALRLLGEEIEGDDEPPDGLPPQAERVAGSTVAVPPIVAEDHELVVERAVDEAAEEREKTDDPPHKRKGRRRGIGNA